MDTNLDTAITILFIFIISLGIIFFLNMTVRYFGKITKFEFLLIVVIMGFSLGYALSLLNYQKSQKEIHDLQRITDIQLIAEGFDSYLNSTDYDGRVFSSLPKCPESRYIGTGPGNIDLVSILEKYYLSEMPIDPFALDKTNTLYTICVNENLRIEIGAPRSELTKVISVIK